MVIRSVNLTDDQVKFFQENSYCRSSFIRGLIDDSQAFKEWRMANGG